MTCYCCLAVARFTQAIAKLKPATDGVYIPETCSGDRYHVKAQSTYQLGLCTAWLHSCLLPQYMLSNAVTASSKILPMMDDCCCGLNLLPMLVANDKTQWQIWVTIRAQVNMGAWKGSCECWFFIVAVPSYMDANMLSIKHVMFGWAVTHACTGQGKCMTNKRDLNEHVKQDPSLGFCPEGLR